MLLRLGTAHARKIPMIPDTLDFLLLSTDYDLLKAITAGLKQLNGRLNCATSVESGGDYVCRRKLDGIAVALRVPEALEFIRTVRDGHSNRLAAIFAVVEGPADVAKVIAAGANHAIQRPITAERVLAGLDSAKEAMARERRRYFRHEIVLPVVLNTPEGEHKVTMTNVSEGGMAIRASRPLPTRSLIEFRFEVPSIAPAPIRGKGEIAWTSTEGGIGVRFHSFHGGSERHLQNWLQTRENLASS